MLEIASVLLLLLLLLQFLLYYWQSRRLTNIFEHLSARLIKPQIANKNVLFGLDFHKKLQLF